LIKKFPSVWEKMSENCGGGFFDSHCKSTLYLLVVLAHPGDTLVKDKTYC